LVRAARCHLAVLTSRGADAGPAGDCVALGRHPASDPSFCRVCRRLFRCGQFSPYGLDERLLFFGMYPA
jgi:hypothetical protein